MEAPLRTALLMTLAAMALSALGCASSINIEPSKDMVPVIVGPVDRIGGEPSMVNSPCEDKDFRSWKVNYFIFGKTNILKTNLTKHVGQPFYGPVVGKTPRRIYLKELYASSWGGGLLFLINASNARATLTYSSCTNPETVPFKEGK